MYLPLVPRGSFVENWDPENLLKNLAPVCNCNNMHYENTDIDSENGKTENVDNEIIRPSHFLVTGDVHLFVVSCLHLLRFLGWGPAPAWSGGGFPLES